MQKLVVLPGHRTQPLVFGQQLSAAAPILQQHPITELELKGMFQAGDRTGYRMLSALPQALPRLQTLSLVMNKQRPRVVEEALLEVHQPELSTLRLLGTALLCSHHMQVWARLQVVCPSSWLHHLKLPALSFEGTYLMGSAHLAFSTARSQPAERGGKKR